MWNIKEILRGYSLCNREGNFARKSFNAIQPVDGQEHRSGNGGESGKEEQQTSRARKRNML
jgi:hypothetical protein